MKSITDLNGIGLNTNDYTDNRDPSITFSTLTPSTQSLSVYQGAAHSLPVGSNITEIINYPYIGATYIIDLRSTTLDCEVQWASLPSYCVITKPAHNVWKVTGITSTADWALVRSPTVIINEDILTDISYLVTIEYQTTKYVSWTVNIHTLLYDILSDSTEFLFEDGVTEVLTGTPRIFDYRVNQSTWTVTITPDALTVFSSWYTAGIGGTYSQNPTTKIITLTGTKEQINTHLASIHFTANATNELDLVLSYYAINNTGLLSGTKTQQLTCNTIKYLGFVGQYNTGYYEDRSFVFENLPPITDYDNLLANGNTPKTISISDGFTGLFTGEALRKYSLFGDVDNTAIEVDVYYPYVNMPSTPTERSHQATISTTGDITSHSFTIEFFFWPSSSGDTSYEVPIICKCPSASAYATGSNWRINFERTYNNVNNRIKFYKDGSYIDSGGGVNLDQWNHVVIQREAFAINQGGYPADEKSALWTIYVNGTRRHNTGVIQLDYVGYSNTNNLKVGYTVPQYPANFAHRYAVDELRISDNVRYTGSTLTVPTARHIVDGNTILLNHFTGSVGGSTSYDSAKTVSITTTNPKFGNGSIKLNDGNLTVNASEDWNWYNGDFTVESFFFNQRTVATKPANIGLMTPSSSTNYWSFGIDSSDKGRFYYYDGSERNLVGTTTLSKTAWHHVALCFKRKTKTLTLFVNGIAEATAKVTGNPQFSSTLGLSIGAYSQNYANAFMDEVRISKMCRYVNNFTVPTIAFVVDNYTSLLLHGDGYNGSVITDSSIAVNGSIYTYDIVPTTLSNIRTASYNGVGATFTYTNGVARLTGNKSQINNNLQSVLFRPASDYTGTIPFTCTGTMPTGASRTKSVTVNNFGVHDEVSNIGLTRTYDNTTFQLIFSGNTPQITDMDETNPSYTITLTSPNGKFGTSAANAVSNYTYTGTKAQINALFSTLGFAYVSGTYNTTFNYTQTKGGVTQVSTSATLNGPSYVYTPTTVPSYGTATMNEGDIDIAVTHPVTFSYLNTSLTLVISPVSISVTPSNSFSWNVYWTGDTSGMTIIKSGNDYVISGIDTIAKWNTIKAAKFATNSVSYGTFTFQFSLTAPSPRPMTYTWGSTVTINNVEPIPPFMDSPGFYVYYKHYSYSSGVANRLDLLTSIVLNDPSGKDTPKTWTMSFTPTTTLDIVGTYVLYTGYNAGYGATASVSGNVLSITGTATQINNTMSATMVTIRSDVLIDFVISCNATTTGGVESGTRNIYLTNQDYNFISGTSASVFSTGSEGLLTNCPEITEANYDNYTLRVYPDHTSNITSIRCRDSGYAVSQGVYYNTSYLAPYNMNVAITQDGTFAITNGKGSNVFYFSTLNSNGGWSDTGAVATIAFPSYTGATTVESMAVAYNNGTITLALLYRRNYTNNINIPCTTVTMYSITNPTSPTYIGKLVGNTIYTAKTLNGGAIDLNRSFASESQFKISQDGTKLKYVDYTTDTTVTGKAVIFSGTYANSTLSGSYVELDYPMIEPVIATDTTGNYMAVKQHIGVTPLTGVDSTRICTYYGNTLTGTLLPSGNIIATPCFKTDSKILLFDYNNSRRLIITKNTSSTTSAWTIITNDSTMPTYSAYLKAQPDRYGYKFAVVRKLSTSLYETIDMYDVVNDQLVYINTVTVPYLYTTVDLYGGTSVLFVDTPNIAVYALAKPDVSGSYSKLVSYYPTFSYMGTYVTSDPTTKIVTISNRTAGSISKYMNGGCYVTPSATADFMLLFEVTNNTTGTVKIRSKPMTKQ